MTAAYLYVRFSTTAQEDGESWARQIRTGSQLIEDRGWRHEATIEDLGRSAWKGVHLSDGNLGKFSERVRAGDIEPGSYLVVEKTDRLSRQGWEALFDWLREMTRKGLNIVTVDGHLFTQETMRDQISIIKILLEGDANKAYSDTISGRVLDSVQAKLKDAAERGTIISAHGPSWLQLAADRSHWTVIPEKVAIVNKVYELASEGRGPRWIARQLNDEGIPGLRDGRTKKVTWDESVVRYLLTSRAVEGDYVAGENNPTRVKTQGVTISGYFPRIVDAALVERVRSQVDKRKLNHGRQPRKGVNLYSGLIFCNACGSRMYIRTGYKGASNYQCSAAAVKGCDNKQTFSLERFEAASLDAILDLALEDRFFSQAETTYPLTVAAAEARKTLADIDARIQRAMDMVLEGTGADLFRARLPQLQAERDDAQRDVEEADAALRQARGQVSASEHQRRVLEVREAIQDQDRETRETARLRVREALHGLVRKVWCNGSEVWKGQTRRTLTVELLGGLGAIKFSNEGELLASVNMAGPDGLLGKQGFDAETLARAASLPKERPITATQVNTLSRRSRRARS